MTVQNTAILNKLWKPMPSDEYRTKPLDENCYPVGCAHAQS
jgi:hypothetical protein